ncbi:NAD(P)-binding protein [Melanomma pulvis-pyrius CBS 109.77]|uniref:NAD(P)-binding protein n=1 Tax=Melanomma pulvis-pyrius CBS 109.77 TaxID=1314802 RepID=A0A6A6XTL6_9PLEO|nr:NAD(P)-binding protein [Melanomma pulvis-pyrius CBS 109.77]
MVKIAVAGGSGQVAHEIIDALIATGKHEITILSRNASAGDSAPGVMWRAVNYDDKSSLVGALQGIHTVLSFIQLLSDPENKSQKTLIDAAIVAGVNRFAPSEWGSSGTVDMPWWTGKEEVREYLKKVNEKGKVLQYTLIQPGLFLDYLASPYKTAKHVAPLDTMFDFQNRRAIVVEGYDAIMTLTTAEDLAAVVAGAVDYDGEWPEIGGISGNRIPISQILKIGEEVRGRPFTIETVKLDDLENGELKTSWILGKRHKAFAGDDDEAARMLKTVLIGMLLSSTKGAWDVSDEFNRLLPDYNFTQAEDFLTQVWEGKP